MKAMSWSMIEVLETRDDLIKLIVEVIGKLFGQEIKPDSLEFSEPPNPELGDLTLPCFFLAKIAKTSPAKIAVSLAEALRPQLPADFTEVKNTGPYLNFTVRRGRSIQRVCDLVLQEVDRFGTVTDGVGQTMMIEYSGPNSNKALHLGHLRNNQLGISLLNIMAAAGYRVIPVNIINDRGIAICKSMVAYQLWYQPQTPQSVGKKGDHFVGECYARFQEELDNEYAAWLAECKALTLQEVEALAETDQDTLRAEFDQQSKLLKQANQMLIEWEAGNHQVRQLWTTMNSWVYDGFSQTYLRQGVHFDKVYLESDTYDQGRAIALQHEAAGTLAQAGLMFRDERNNLVFDLERFGLTQPGKPKVLIRGDGTTIYITQDIGTAVQRFEEFAPLNQLVYVVAREQELHFKQLFKMLELFGYPWAAQLFHRSYGMVRLTDGKMSSRRLKEGGVFLADDLMDHLHDLARQEILKRYGDTGDEYDADDLERRAEQIGLAALKYFLLRTSAEKDMIFEPAESLAFEGNTGPYLLYAYARIKSILRRAEVISETADLTVLNETVEIMLAKKLAQLPSVVSQAAREFNPTPVASWCYEVAKAFSQFYNHCQIIGSGDTLEPARLRLAFATAVALGNGLKLLGIEPLERM
ncbi:MAG: arginine--tRNA ligase [Candidatus Buchananbacteria bacterium]|nr:arginine--tRNA ligase [Candidatus Buchananbacteria bacterium]